MAVIVPVRLTNRIARFYCEPEVQVKLKTFFRYEVPNARFTPGYISGAWDGYHNLMRAGCVSTGLFLARRKRLERHGYVFHIDDQRQLPAFRSVPASDKARPYQIQAVEAMVTHSNTGGLVLCATGTGKTFIAGEYLRRLAGSACFIVDELTLLDQTRRAFAKQLSEPIGIVGDGEFKPQRITVATIQTLHLHHKNKVFQKWFRSLDVLIVDEFHVCMNQRNVDVVRTIRPKAVFGLTATLETEQRAVHLEATALSGPVIFRYTLEQGIREGYLSPTIGVAVRFRAKQRPQFVPADSAGKYRMFITENEDRNRCIAALAAEAVRRGYRAVVIVEHLRHLRRLSALLRGVKHCVLCGAYKMEERRKAIRQMEAGKLPLIIATRVFGKGVDIQTVNVTIDATGLPSANSAAQRLGRGTRRAEGKVGLIHLDISDEGNHFSRAARSRQQSIRSRGVPVVDVSWSGRATTVFDTAEHALREMPVKTGSKATKIRA
jgi:superfamily II DNA or RNA helicase